MKQWKVVDIYVERHLLVQEPVSNRYAVVQPYLRFHFPWFQLSMVNCVPKRVMENSRNKQLLSCELHSILSITMTSLALPLHPMNHPFVQHMDDVNGPHPLVT